MMRKLLASIDFGLAAMNFVLFFGNLARENLITCAINFGACVLCGCVGAAILFDEE